MKINKTLNCLVVLATLAWLLPTAALAQYVRTDLTSNQPGAPNTSPHLVNGWGLVQLGTSPFWISDNGTGLSTLYNGAGQLFPSPQNPLVVAIPPAPGSTPGTLGSPTGVIGNISLFTNSPEFFVSNGTSSAPATQDWRSLLMQKAAKHFFTRPTTAQTARLTCTTAHSPACDRLATLRFRGTMPLMGFRRLAARFG